MSSSYADTGHGRRARACAVGVAGALALASAFGADAPAPVRIAVFTFEFEDLTPAAVLLKQPVDSATTMEKVSSAAREELAHTGRYTPVDVSKVEAGAVADKSLSDCNGCEASLAAQLGAQQSMIGQVRKVTETDYYVVIRIRDASTGKVLDQEEALFAGDQSGWPTGVRMLIRHQVLPNQQDGANSNLK
jgi:hypothetical protein